MTHGPRRARWRQPGIYLLLFHCLVPTAAPAHASPASIPSPRSCKPLPPVELELRASDAGVGAALPFELRVRANRPVEDLRLEILVPSGRGPRPMRQALADRLDARGEILRKLSATLPAHGPAEIFARVEFRLPGGGRLSRAAYLQFQDGLPATHAPTRIVRSGAETVAEYPAGGVR